MTDNKTTKTISDKKTPGEINKKTIDNQPIGQPTNRPTNQPNKQTT